MADLQNTALHQKHITRIKAYPDFTVKSRYTGRTIRVSVGHTVKTDRFGIYGHTVKGDLERAINIFDSIFDKLLALMACFQKWVIKQ